MSASVGRQNILSADLDICQGPFPEVLQLVSTQCASCNDHPSPGQRQPPQCHGRLETTLAKPPVHSPWEMCRSFTALAARRQQHGTPISYLHLTSSLSSSAYIHSSSQKHRNLGRMMMRFRATAVAAAFQNCNGSRERAIRCTSVLPWARILGEPDACSHQQAASTLQATPHQIDITEATARCGHPGAIRHHGAGHAN